MPKILFASNNISHFPGSIPGSVAGTFDASRVPYAVVLTNYQLVNAPDFAPSALTTTWFHFRVTTDGSPFGIPSGNPAVLFQCSDGLNRNILRITKRSLDNAQSLVLSLSNGSTTLTVNGDVPLMRSKMNAVDIQITITNVLIRADVYVNGSLTGFAQFGSNPNSMSNPIRFALGCSHVDSLSQGQNYSEILVSEGDTRNARLNFLRPVSTGAFSQWDGSVAALGDDDPTTGLYTKVAAERHTMGLSAYVGAYNISNLVSVSQTTRGLNSPTKLKHTVRLSGINYDSPDLNIPFGLQYNIVDLALNPGTSLPWTADDLSTLETGFLSVA